MMSRALRVQKNELDRLAATLRYYMYIYICMMCIYTHESYIRMYTLYPLRERRVRLTCRRTSWTVFADSNIYKGVYECVGNGSILVYTR